MGSTSARAALSGDELPAITTPPPGPRSRAAAKRLRRAEGAAIWGAEEAPVVWSRARGSVVVDLDGNRYVDLTAGFGVVSLGHAAPEVARAVSAQARKLTQGLGDIMPHDPRVKLVRKLAGLGGGGLNRALLAATGSEAVELALKTAHVATGKRRVVAFTGAYHGQSYGALAVSDYPGLRAPVERQVADIAIRVPYPYEYRCPLQRRCERCDLRCLDSALDVVDREIAGPDPPGAVIVEPIQGRSGCVIPPPEFLPRLRAATRERGLILILDEVMTGACRTGPFWAWERGGTAAEPDLVAAGKGIGGGVAIAAVLGRAEWMNAWREHVPRSGEAPHSSTYYAHPLACAGTLRALKRLTEPELRAHVERVGAELLAGLRSLQAEHAAVGDARGAGLLAAIELVRDRASREPAPERAAEVVRALLYEGVLVYPGGVHDNVITFTP
ncbi:MAG: aminotransferase class III-fold pyridoxal phosphate-dependent enzyme, partial [Candidatus Latescibacteria bacterium]|nr:aminotransferase class III-fold pyridoxal phosphate-dependent enzyme [Candidatus Latescibacterota bacterium]